MVYLGVELHRRCHTSWPWMSAATWSSADESVPIRRPSSGCSGSSSRNRSRWPSRRPSGGGGSRTCWPMSGSPPTWPSPGHEGDLLGPGQERRRRCEDARPPSPDQPPARGLDRPAGGPGGPTPGQDASFHGPDPVSSQVPDPCACGRGRGASGDGRPVWRGWPHVLAEASLPSRSRARIDAHLRLVEAVDQEITRAERELRYLFHGDNRVVRLLPIPGIGFPHRRHCGGRGVGRGSLQRPDWLCCWAGLTPLERSSAEHTRRRHISKQGSRWLRWVLVEAASRARSNEALRPYLDRVARRRGTKIATVALARRLLTLSFYALRDEAGCRALPVR
jgi:Transposase IS116/IS110/IS902 family